MIRIECPTCGQALTPGLRDLRVRVLCPRCRMEMVLSDLVPLDAPLEPDVPGLEASDTLPDVVEEAKTITLEANNNRTSATEDDAATRDAAAFTAPMLTPSPGAAQVSDTLRARTQLAFADPTVFSNPLSLDPQAMGDFRHMVAPLPSGPRFSDTTLAAARFDAAIAPFRPLAFVAIAGALALGEVGSYSLTLPWTFFAAVAFLAYFRFAGFRVSAGAHGGAELASRLSVALNTGLQGWWQDVRGCKGGAASFQVDVIGRAVRHLGVFATVAIEFCQIISVFPPPSPLALMTVSLTTAGWALEMIGRALSAGSPLRDRAPAFAGLVSSLPPAGNREAWLGWCADKEPIFSSVFARLATFEVSPTASLQATEVSLTRHLQRMLGPGVCVPAGKQPGARADENGLLIAGALLVRVWELKEKNDIRAHEEALTRLVWWRGAVAVLAVPRGLEGAQVYLHDEILRLRRVMAIAALSVPIALPLSPVLPPV